MTIKSLAFHPADEASANETPPTRWRGPTPSHDDARTHFRASFASANKAGSVACWVPGARYQRRTWAPLLLLFRFSRANISGTTANDGCRVGRSGPLGVALSKRNYNMCWHRVSPPPPLHILILLFLPPLLKYDNLSRSKSYKSALRNVQKQHKGWLEGEPGRPPCFFLFCFFNWVWSN